MRTVLYYACDEAVRSAIMARSRLTPVFCITAWTSESDGSAGLASRSMSRRAHASGDMSSSVGEFESLDTDTWRAIASMRARLSKSSDDCTSAMAMLRQRGEVDPDGDTRPGEGGGGAESDSCGDADDFVKSNCQLTTRAAAASRGGTAKLLLDRLGVCACGRATRLLDRLALFSLSYCNDENERGGGVFTADWCTELVRIIVTTSTFSGWVISSSRKLARCSTSLYFARSCASPSRLGSTGLLRREEFPVRTATGTRGRSVAAATGVLRVREGEDERYGLDDERPGECLAAAIVLALSINLEDSVRCTPGRPVPLAINLAFSLIYADFERLSSDSLAPGLARGGATSPWCIMASARSRSELDRPGLDGRPRGDCAWLCFAFLRNSVNPSCDARNSADSAIVASTQCLLSTFRYVGKALG